MVGKLTGAAIRGVAMAVLVMMPSLIAPGLSEDNAPIVLLAALVAALLTYFEYQSTFPSLIEFRDAGPFNRLRYATLFVMLLVLSIMCLGKTVPNDLSETFNSVGSILGQAIDFKFSPVRLVVLMLPSHAPADLIDNVRTAAGMTYLISLVAMFAFLVLVRILDWPTRSGAFNVWVNLPLFDPTVGGDVIGRLRKDSSVNIVLGFLLPFFIPLAVTTASDFVNPEAMENPQTLIWTMSAWAFLPASMIMRGIALGKIADMVEEKRRRAYEEAGHDINAAHA